MHKKNDKIEKKHSKRAKFRQEDARRERHPRKKKKFGQNFLKDHSVVDTMIDRVEIDASTNIMEIGAGAGFLTKAILEQTKCKRLVSFEIDEEWYMELQRTIADSRFDLRLTDVLDLDWNELEELAPMVMLANLPYQISFPVLFRIQRHKHLFREGVVMLQEEVAQKLVATHGRSFSQVTLFLKHHFEFELLCKIGPEAFSPPPKVCSRLVHFKPRLKTEPIKNEERFWKFVKSAFAHPRQTLRKNLKHAGYDINKISEESLKLRSQQMTFDDFLELWEKEILN
jgi:16S rRNA (adenine1518-N6/adenine1519-N6)-dimethyltransferase